MSELEPKTERHRNPYKEIPTCDCCHFAAGVYLQITGKMQGKSICQWCLEELKKLNLNPKRK